MSPWKKIRQRIEAALCRLGFWLFPHLPRPVLLALSRAGGNLAFVLAGAQRRVALENLRLAFGDMLSDTERRRIARRSFQSFARTGLESMSSTRLARDGLDANFFFEPGALELLRELTARGRGLLALTLHYGNWEWLSLAWSMAGYPMTAVSQPIKNPRVEEFFRRHREHLGHRLIHRRHAARQLYKTLKRGGGVGLLVDLNSSTEEGGAFYDFFGVPALTTRIVGHLALRTGAPIVFSIAHPEADGRYRISIGPEIPCDPSAPLEAETDAITRRWLAHCERVIRERPEVWMWMYKRWKVRPSPPLGRFPSYSFHDPKIPAALARD